MFKSFVILLLFCSCFSDRNCKKLKIPENVKNNTSEIIIFHSRNSSKFKQITNPEKITQFISLLDNNCSVFIKTGPNYKIIFFNKSGFKIDSLYINNTNYLKKGGVVYELGEEINWDEF